VSGYCLFDGAMAFHMVSHSKLFADTGLPWLAPLLAHQDLRLAGPFLIAHERVKRDSPEWQEIVRLVGAFPHALHMSVIQSPLDLPGLAAHLRQFAAFRDSLGDIYGLRIADNRVLAYLPRVLTREQWDSLTAPMESWTPRNRLGEQYLLPLHATRLQRSGTPDPIHLSDTQIDQLIEAGEPDALLARINRAPRLDNERETQARHEAACCCIRFWQACGRSDQGVLLALARSLFHQGIQHRDDPARMQALVRDAIALVK